MALAKSRFISSLRSDDGKRLLVDLLKEAPARNALAPVLNGAETRLKDLAAKEVATFVAHAEMSLRASATALTDRVHQDVQDHLNSYQDKITEAVREQLSNLQKEIAQQVRPGPPRSNRELARKYGVSIREVKRRRQLNWTEQGAKKAKEANKRFQASKSMAQKLGGKLLSAYVTPAITTLF
jgi:hypothetical protein